MKKNLTKYKTFGLKIWSSDNPRQRPAGLLCFAIVFCLLLVSPIITFAQAVSGVTGVVTDPSGNLIPGVQVTLVDTKTAKELTTVTNDQGSYTFNNVQPGAGYRLTFAAQGFQTFVLNAVQLGIGKTETQNAQLTAGQIAETVEVTSTTGDATLNTTDASIGNIIGRRQLSELPIQIRGTPAALIGLQPGAIGTNVGAGATGGTRTGSVTGSRADQGNITVDGIDANDVTTQQAFATVGNAPIDSIQEFRAVTSGPNASEGRSSGGQIQLATRSGTNDLHGSARIYYRTNATSANDFFSNRTGVPVQGLQRRQFGGNLGGPIPLLNFGEGGPSVRSGKDKAFFFFDYEGRRDDSQSVTTRIVPLQSFREGRVGYVNNNAGCTAASRANTTPNCISYLSLAQVAALDPRGVGSNQALLSLINSRYPLPNDLTGGNGVNTGLYRFNAPVQVNNNIYTGRIDVVPTNSQRAFVRFTISRNASTNAVQQFPGDADAQTFSDKSYGIASQHNWAITENLTNTITAGLSKSSNVFAPASSPAFPNIFALGAGIVAPFASISFQDRNVFVPTFRDDVTYTTGSHTFLFGGVYKPIRQKPSLANDFNFPTLGIGGATTQLNAALRPANIANIAAVRTAFDSAFTSILGRYASIQTNFTYDPQGNAFAPGTGRTRNYAYNEYEFYAQDNWKIRSDLTLNLGVRYHLYPAPYEVNGFQAGNNVDYQELVDLRIRNAANGIAGPTAEPFTSFNLNGKGNGGDPLYKTDKNNFAPRLGFAYNPSFDGGILGAIFGDRKTVLRGNASMVYDRVGGAISFIQDQSNFLFDNSTVRQFGNTNPATALLNDPRFTGVTSLPIQNTAPVIVRPFTPYVTNGVPVGLISNRSNYVVAKDFQVPYSYTFNFGVQRELPGNFLLDVAYVGRLGRKLFVQADAAQTLNFKDAASGQFMFDAFNAIQAQLNAGVVNLSPQPWLENQIAAVRGPGFCAAQTGGGNCSTLVANPQTGLFPDLFAVGGSGDTVQQLYLNNLIRPNVGISGQFAVNRYITNLGTSEYHGMLVSLQRRLSQGLEFEVNYTWSHSIDNQSSIVNNTAASGIICDITNLDRCRGDSDFDIRHLFNANFIYDLPFGRGRAFGSDIPKWLDAVVGGFAISGIVGARSGFAINGSTGSFPVSFTVDSPPIPTGDRSAFRSNIRTTPAGIQFFDDPVAAQAALRYPRHGEIGPRNFFRSPSFVNFDLGLSKRFALPWFEGHRVTVRADSFNVFNQNSFNTPNLTYQGGSFGLITSSLSTPRVFQFAIRYDF